MTKEQLIEAIKEASRNGDYTLIDALCALLAKLEESKWTVEFTSTDGVVFLDDRRNMTHQEAREWATWILSESPSEWAHDGAPYKLQSVRPIRVKE